MKQDVRWSGRIPCQSVLFNQRQFNSFPMTTVYSSFRWQHFLEERRGPLCCIEKINLSFHFLTSLWCIKRFYKTFKTFIKPFQGPQRSVKIIKNKVNFYFNVIFLNANCFLTHLLSVQLTLRQLNERNMGTLSSAMNLV